MANAKKPPVKRTIVRVADAAGSGSADPAERSAARGAVKAKAGPKRLGAVILWILALAAEAAVIMLLGGYLYLPMDPTIWLIGGIVLDLVLVVIGSLLWKKANDLDPPSGKNKLRFFLWNNMGVIVAVLAFFPLIIILLRDKKLDPKLKRIASIAAVVALAIAGLFSYDWNPVSAEQQASLQDSLSGQLVYWTPFGTRFHVDPNCPTLSRSATVYEGTIDQAFEANRGTPCQVCSSEYEVQLDGSPSTQP